MGDGLGHGPQVLKRVQTRRLDRPHREKVVCGVTH